MEEKALEIMQNHILKLQNQIENQKISIADEFIILQGRKEPPKNAKELSFYMEDIEELNNKIKELEYDKIRETILSKIYMEIMVACGKA